MYMWTFISLFNLSPSKFTGPGKRAFYLQHCIMLLTVPEAVLSHSKVRSRSAGECILLLLLPVLEAGFRHNMWKIRSAVQSTNLGLSSLLSHNETRKRSGEQFCLYTPHRCSWDSLVHLESEKIRVHWVLALQGLVAQWPWSTFEDNTSDLSTLCQAVTSPNSSLLV